MDVVDYYLTRRVKNSKWDLSERKLQKLMYFSQGHFMSMYGGNVLFDDEFIRCSGGVEIVEIRSMFGKYLFNSIECDVCGDYLRLGESERVVLYYVWDTYGHISGKFLEELIFQRDSVLNHCIGDVIESVEIFEDFIVNR